MPRWTTSHWFASLVAKMKMRCARPSAEWKRAPSKRASKSCKGVPKSAKNLQSDATSFPKAGFSSSPSTCSATCSGKSPSPTSSASPQSMDERLFRDRFIDWYELMALGGAVTAFLYGELKYNLEKEVDKKIKEKELKEKQSEIERKDMEIEHLQTRLQEKKSWWFF